MLALGLDYLKLVNLEMSKFGTNHELLLFKLNCMYLIIISVQIVYILSVILYMYCCSDVAKIRL